LFNPRTDQWSEHFRWDGAILAGLIPVGRVTIHVLVINESMFLRNRGALMEEGRYF